MIETLEAQMRAMQILMKMQDITANNLANINTPGYKSSDVFFKMMQEKINGKTVSRSEPQQQVDMTQGVLKPTHNTFDFGIEGKGFFVVQNNSGIQLTRDGRMHIDTNGYLVDGNGSKVMSDSGPIYMPQYLKAGDKDGVQPKIDVAKDGTIRINNKVYDQLKIVDVKDVTKLQREGKNYFSVDPKLMVDDQIGNNVMQGYYESSNVSSLNEMVDMMKTTKMFESQQRVIQTTDEMLGRAASQLAKF
ncbi:MAG TPA: flagellar hook-basal body protein [Bacteroidales bacterium]|nr:flagellar hook-basal body protein [Bacteroidales bacterium]